MAGEERPLSAKMQRQLDKPVKRQTQAEVVRTSIGPTRLRPSDERLYVALRERTARWINGKGELTEEVLNHPLVAEHNLTFGELGESTRKKIVSDTLEQLGFPVGDIKNIIVGEKGERILFVRGRPGPQKLIIITNPKGASAAESLARFLQKAHRKDHITRTIHLVTHGAPEFR